MEKKSMFSNIVHDSPYYCSSSSIAAKNGIEYHANVINDPDGQYCVFTRVDSTTKATIELKRIYARDSREFNIREGADPNKDNGKYGNVSIAIDGSDLHFVIEVRYDGVNKPRFGVFRGLVT